MNDGMLTRATPVRFPRLRLRLRTQEAIEGYLYITPWILGFVIFLAGPMLASVVLSLFRYNIIGSPVYTGLENYRKALTDDPVFWQSVENTLYYTGISVPLGVVGSLFLALILNQRLRGTSLFRTLFFMPSVTPVVAAVLLWVWIFHPEVGLVNYLLSLAGIEGPGWMASTEWVKPAIIIITLWGGLGGGRMIIFLAGLQGVPKELYEVAEIDGAGAWRKFLAVTLPLISPALFFNLVLGMIGALRVFTEALVATNGGPANASKFYMLYLYLNAFSYLQMGYASAMAWLFFVVVIVFTLIQFWLSSRWVYYEGEVRR